MRYILELSTFNGPVVNTNISKEQSDSLLKGTTITGKHGYYKVDGRNYNFKEDTLIIKASNLTTKREDSDSDVRTTNKGGLCNSGWGCKSGDPDDHTDCYSPRNTGSYVQLGPQH